MISPFILDKSRYQWIVNQQGELIRGPDWEKAWKMGVRIVVHRVTVGNYYVDSAAKVDYDLCKSFGFLQTFYHVTTPEYPADEQVDWFLGHLPGDPDIPLVIDNELSRKQNKQKITACTQKIFQLVEEQAKEPSLNYTSQGFWDSWLLSWSGWSRYPLFVAWYPDDLNYPVEDFYWKRCPSPYLEKTVVNGVTSYKCNWTFWQKWADGDALGYEYGMRSGDVDLSWYNGTRETFKAQFGVELPDNEVTEPQYIEIAPKPEVYATYKNGGKLMKMKDRKYFKKDKRK